MALPTQAHVDQVHALFRARFPDSRLNVSYDWRDERFYVSHPSDTGGVPGRSYFGLRTVADAVRWIESRDAVDMVARSPKVGRRRNPDIQIRDLERAAWYGDLSAMDSLASWAIRRGDSVLGSRAIYMIYALAEGTTQHGSERRKLNAILSRLQRAGFEYQGERIRRPNPSLIRTPGPTPFDGRKPCLSKNGNRRCSLALGHYNGWHIASDGARWKQTFRDPNPPRRSNSDATLRDLERRAAAGDPRAWEKATVERIRNGQDAEVARILAIRDPGEGLFRLASELQRNDRNGTYLEALHGDPIFDEWDSVIGYEQLPLAARTELLEELKNIAVVQIIDSRRSPHGTRSAADFLGLGR